MHTKVIFSEKKKFKDAVLLVGLPGIGLVGKIALDHMVSQLKPKKIGEVVSDSFPPSVKTDQAVLDLISDEIYYKKLGSKDVLFLGGPVQPTLDFRAGSAQEHYEFAETVAREMKAVGVSRIYTLAGISAGESRMSREPRIIVAATSKKMLSEFKGNGMVADRGEGLISGAAGLVLGMGKRIGVEGACLMGETNPHLIYGDHGAAKKILERLMDMFSFKVNMSELEQESREVQEAFTKMNKKIKQQQEFENPGDLSYVR